MLLAALTASLTKFHVETFLVYFCHFLVSIISLKPSYGLKHYLLHLCQMNNSYGILHLLYNTILGSTAFGRAVLLLG